MDAIVYLFINYMIVYKLLHSITSDTRPVATAHSDPLIPPQAMLFVRDSNIKVDGKGLSYILQIALTKSTKQRPLKRNVEVS